MTIEITTWNSADVPDFLREYQNELEIEFGSEFNSRMADVYAQLKERHSGIRHLFWNNYWNEADIDGMVCETFRRYLERVGAKLWQTQGYDVAPLEPLVEDGDLIGFSLPTIPRPAERIRDLEKHTYEYPKGMLNEIARNLRSDHARKLKVDRRRVEISNRSVELTTRRNGKPEDLRPSSFQGLYHPPRNEEERLVLQCRNHEFRQLYVAALKKLGAVQRAAWILCKDELLTREQAEPLLASTLHWRTARVALDARPLKAVEASHLLGRADVSADVSRAGTRLAEELADMSPARAWDTAPQKFPGDYLIGLPRLGPTRAIRPLDVLDTGRLDDPLD
jgi:hypothetical protein